MDAKEIQQQDPCGPHCLEVDSFGTYGGVLLSDEITHYAEKHQMISPFTRHNLKPASYYLTIGDEYAVGGRTAVLQDKPGEDEIRIPSFQVAIIKTGEIIRLPRFMIARWNIRVSRAYEGLLWVGGPQVDPGWSGHLYCPIYNLSDNPVTLRKGSPIATIDFIKTTPYKRDRAAAGLETPVDFKPKKKRSSIGDYDPEKLGSGLFGEVARLGAKADSAMSEVHRFGARLDWGTGMFMAIIAVFIAAFALLVGSAHEITYEIDGKTVAAEVAFPWWTYLAASLSVVAFVSMMAALWILLRRNKTGN